MEDGRCCIRKDARDAAKLLLPPVAGLVEPQGMTRRERLNAAIQGVGFGNVAPEEEANVAGRFRSGVNVTAGKEGFDL
jgi:hypothetical protein